MAVERDASDSVRPTADVCATLTSLRRGETHAVAEAEQILASASSILLVDWPSNEVPDTLASAGYTVVVKGGPQADNFLLREVHDKQVVVRKLGRAPEQADVVYCHRPLEELSGILVMAKALRARAVWSQSGRASSGAKDPKGCWVPEEASRTQRSLVESAGLRYVDEVYIVEVARRLGLHQ